MTEQKERDELHGLLYAAQLAISAFCDEYEWIGDFGYHVPEEAERVLIEDAIQGLLADETFLRTFNSWQDNVRENELYALRIALAQERERCEKACDSYTDKNGYIQRADNLKASIRALPPTTPDDVLRVMKDAARWREALADGVRVTIRADGTKIYSRDAAMEGK